MSGSLRQWPDVPPYKGLGYFGPEDIPLFAGREGSVRALAERLTLPTTRLLLLHGPTGSGKTSLLRAGLIPFLENQRGRYGFSQQDGQAVFVRCTASPLRALAAEVYRAATAAIIETEDGPERLDLAASLPHGESAASFVESAGSTSKTMIESLSIIGGARPHRFVMIVDQAEEVLTLNPRSSRDCEEFFTFIGEFSRTQFDLRLILAIRTEYYGKFIARIGQDARHGSRVETFFLDTLTESEIVGAISRPTVKVPVGGYSPPFDRYHFAFEPGVPEAIVSDVVGSGHVKGGVLPVVQVVCENLHRSVKESRGGNGGAFVISMADYRAMPDVTKQLDDYLVRKLRLFKGGSRRHSLDIDAEADRWKEVLSNLSSPQSDGTVVTRFVEEADLKALAAKEKCRLPTAETIQYLSQPSVRVLRREVLAESVDGSTPVVAYSLGHDAIALAIHQWKSGRAEASKAVALWKTSALKWFAALVTVSLLVLGWKTLQLKHDAALALEREQSLQSGVIFEDDPQLGVYIALHALANRDYGGPLALDLRPAVSALDRAVQDSRVRSTLVHSGEKLSGLSATNIDLATFSLDAKWFVTKHRGYISVWDGRVQDGRLVNGQRPHARRQFAPIGDLDNKPPLRVAVGGNSRLAVGASDRIEIYTLPNLDHPHLTVRLAGSGPQVDGPITSLALTADDRLVAAGFQTGDIKVWDLITGQQIHARREHEGYVRALWFSPDSAFLVSGSGGRDHTVRLYSVDPKGNLTFKQPLDGHRDDVTALAIGTVGDDKRLMVATGGADGLITVWRSAPERKGLTKDLVLAEPNTINSLALNSDGSRLASSNMDGDVRVRETRDGLVVVALGGHTSRVQGLSFHPETDLLATAAWDSTARVWDARFDHSDAVVNLAVRGDLVASASWDGWATLWRLKGDGKEFVDKFPHPPEAKAVDLTPDGSRLVVGGVSPDVVIWNTRTHVVERRLGPFTDHVGAVAFSKDGAQVAAGSWNGTATLWGADGRLVRTFPAKDKFVERVQFLRTSLTLLVADRATIGLWSLHQPKDHPEQEFTPSGNLYTAALSHDENLVVAGGFDGRVTVWRVSDGTKLSEFHAHTGPIRSVAFSPKDEQLATTSMDKSTKIWSVQDILRGGRVQEALRFPDAAPVFASAWKPDGKYVITGGGDKMVHLHPIAIEDLIASARARLVGLSPPTPLQCQQWFHKPACPPLPPELR